MSRKKQARAEAGTAIRFGIVGVVTTLIHLVVAQGALAAGLAPLVANVTGFAVAFFSGLLGHYHFTFPGTGTFGRAFRRYGVIALAGFLTNNVVLIGLISSGWVGERVALMTAILIVPAATFVASRLWGFAPAKQKQTLSSGPVAEVSCADRDI